MLPITDLIETLKRLAPAIPASTLTAIETDLETKEAEKAADKVKKPKAKNMILPIILDPEGRFAGLKDLAALVVQVPEDTKPEDVVPRLHRAAYEQNRRAKRKRWEFNTLADVAEHAKRGLLKEQNIAIKSGKTIVPMLVDSGVVPRV